MTITLSPEHESALSLYEQGREAMEQGDFDTAAALFAQSVATNPHFKTLELQGECLVRLERPREAIVPLAAATALNLGVRAPAMLADVFLHLGERTDALHMASVALERDAHNKTARAVLDTLSGK